MTYGKLLVMVLLESYNRGNEMKFHLK